MPEGKAELPLNPVVGDGVVRHQSEHAPAQGLATSYQWRALPNRFRNRLHYLGVVTAEESSGSRASMAWELSLPLP
jgi:hypothetical protein